jgi:hypothetical protein
LNNWPLLQAHNRNPSTRETIICVARKFSRVEPIRLKADEMPANKDMKMITMITAAIINSTSEKARAPARRLWHFKDV